MPRISPWIRAAVGMAMLGACIGFFVVTANDDLPVEQGTRVAATVVSERGPSFWPLMNSGRVVVRYSTPSGAMTRTIWLDDATNAPRGSTWTVVYDPQRPGRVRSLTDPNDPYPLLAPFLLVGLMGAALLAWGVWSILGQLRQRRWEAVLKATPAGAYPKRIPLRHYRLSRRTPYVDVAGDELLISLPSAFTAPLTVPVAEVCVVADDPARPALDDSADGWVFRRPIVVPYIPTTSSNAAPNLTMFFTKPQRIPPVRLGQSLGVSRRESCSAAGVLIDGIELRAEHPEAAVTSLIAAGARSTDRPNAWLRDHHQISHDPTEVQQGKARDRRWRRVGIASTILGLGLSHGVVGDDPSTLAIVGFGVAVAALFGLPAWARLRDKQSSGRRN